MVVSSALYGAAYGLFPIGWIVFTAILLYRMTVETGKFEIIKDSIASLTGDQRLQALLIAFAFGAFLEGASGLRDSRRRGRRHAYRARLHAVLRRGHLSDGRHRAGRIRIDRHSHRHVAERHRTAHDVPLGRCGPDLRAARPDRSRVPDAGDGRPESPAGRFAGRRRLRDHVCRTRSSSSPTSSAPISPLFSPPLSL